MFTVDWAAWVALAVVGVQVVSADLVGAIENRCARAMALKGLPAPKEKGARQARSVLQDETELFD